MGTDEAASVAVATLFGVAMLAAVASKVKAGFKLYLLLGLSSAFRCIGFAARAAQLQDPSNTDLAAVSLVFRQVGRRAGSGPAAGRSEGAQHSCQRHGSRQRCSRSQTGSQLAPLTCPLHRQAGYGISIAVLCILMGCYFKNARNEMKPPRSFPGWSVGVRLLIAPVRLRHWATVLHAFPVHAANACASPASHPPPEPEMSR